MSVQVVLVGPDRLSSYTEEWDSVETIQGWLACHAEPFKREVRHVPGPGKPVEISHEDVPGKTVLYPGHRIIRVEYDHSRSEKVKKT